MLVQTEILWDIDRARYDAFLAKGWFRGYGVMYRSEFLCIDDDIFSTVNIRLPLVNHEFTKSQRKVIRKCEEEFTVTISPSRKSKQRDALYEKQKLRFKAFVHDSLQDITRHFDAHKRYTQQEICVYKGRKLVANSYLDLGLTSGASILCNYDPDFAQYSLGMYTMYKEIEYLKANGFEYYYPGYVMDKPSAFDYKKRISNLEFLNPQNKWRSISEFDQTQSKAYFLEQQIGNLERYLKLKGIEATKKLYPYFSTGLMVRTEINLVKQPCLLCWEQDGLIQAATYDVISDNFIFGEIEHCHEFDWSLSDNISNEYQQSKKYLLTIYNWKSVVEISRSSLLLPNYAKS
jgi:arginyl-tRNA--protein-N-Asp/Glu arginylyltransferase